SVRRPLVTIERPSGPFDVAIVIGSAPEQDLKRALARKTGGGGPPEPDHHFEVYYDRCRPPVSVKRIPQPLLVQDGCDDTPPWWMPDWVWPQTEKTSDRPSSHMRSAYKAGNTPLQVESLRAVVGGVDCGPD